MTIYAAPWRRLTARQIHCLDLAAQGLTMTKIGARLYVTEWTVKNDLIAVRTALKARNTAHAVAIAMRNGLLPEAGRPAPRNVARVRLTGTGWPT
jgi:DNA-binding CsgD family transcriptional regulator